MSKGTKTGGLQKDGQEAKGDKKPVVSGKPGGNLQGGAGGSQNQPKKGKSGGGKA